MSIQMKAIQRKFYSVDSVELMIRIESELRVHHGLDQVFRANTFLIINISLAHSSKAKNVAP